MDRGLINGVLFLALKKAFDTVDQKILLASVQDFVQSILSVVTNLQHSSQTREENAVNHKNSRFRIPRTQNYILYTNVRSYSSNLRQ
jgi:hypothetical protein